MSGLIIQFVFPARAAWTVALACTILFGHAGSAAQLSVEASQRRAPEWVRRVPPADKSYYYFVGRATGASSLEAAEQDAAADALRQVVTMIGVEASLSYEHLSGERDSLLTERFLIRGGSQVVGLKRLASYFKKNLVREGDSLRTFYDSNLLVRYGREELEKERKRLQQSAARNLALADRLFSGGRDLEDAGMPAEALSSYGEALDLLDQPLSVADPATGSFRLETTQGLLAAYRRLSLRLWLTALDPVTVRSWEGAPPTADSLLTAALAKALLSQGFHPQVPEQKLRHRALARLSCECRPGRSGALGDGLYVKYWEVSLRLVQPWDSRVLISETYTAKGFGTDLQRAALDGLRQVSGEVFERFAEQAREKLNSQKSRSTYNQEPETGNQNTLRLSRQK